jgi:isopentenyldiphosphate isomerase
LDIDLSERIACLRAHACQADHMLQPATYRQFTHLYDSCARDPALQAALSAWTPERTGREPLLTVDAGGHPAVPTDAILDDLRKRIGERSGIGDWFEEAQIDGHPVLLVARWLCHLAGLRHRTVQLFLDHPSVEGYTLLQVRATTKAEDPGCFDMPCAGHVTGLETPKEALFVELAEELGLGPGDVSDPELLGHYEHRGDEDGAAIYSVEYRTVYRSRLRAGALSRMRFVDREVAAVALFAVDGIERLIESAPQRVASGLAGSWRMY